MVLLKKVTHEKKKGDKRFSRGQRGDGENEHSGFKLCMHFFIVASGLGKGAVLDLAQKWKEKRF